MADPYALYAQRILKLEPLDPIEADPGAAERGQIVHAALGRFMRACGDPLPPDALDRLIAEGRAAFAGIIAYPAVAAFWWPRFERIAAWVLEQEAGRRPGAVPLALEVAGLMTLDGPAGRFEITARADRIDRMADGRLAIIDYKTGTVPSGPQIVQGHAPQLPLEGAIAGIGGFDGIPASEIAELAHWKLSGGHAPGEIRALKPDLVQAAIEDSWNGLTTLIETFDDPATPYLSQPRAGTALRLDGDYAHLARVAEWSAGTGDGEG